MASPTLTTVLLVKDPERAELLAHVRDIRKHSNAVIVLADRADTNLETTLIDSGARFLCHDLQNDFAAHRNWVLEHVESEWTLFLDYDETCPASLWQEIRQIISADSADAIFLRRLDWFLGRKLRYGEVGNIRILRCAKTKLGQGKWRRTVHETWDVPTNQVITVQTPLEHHPHPTLTEFLNKLHWYASLEPQSRPKQSFSRILLEFFCFPPAKFVLNFLGRNGWRDGWQGLVHACLMAYYSLITRVFLYEANCAKKRI